MEAPTAGQPILDIRAVSKRFGGVEALKGVSLQLYPGDVVALAGDNGAGKSTLTKIVSGVYPADGGEIRLDGKPVRFATSEAARRAGIETIYQDLALADNLSIGANIFLGREPMRRALGILPMLDRKAIAAAKETMARLDFHEDPLHAPVGRFSGGQRQAVAIGRAVYWNARVILIDEPTAALGVPEQRKVLALIRGLKSLPLWSNHTSRVRDHFARSRTVEGSISERERSRRIRFAHAIFIYAVMCGSPSITVAGSER